MKVEDVKVKKERLKTQIKERLETILKIEDRVKSNAKAIANGDVSPFFLNLLGNKVTLYGKVGHSISTTFGMSFYEQVCKILADEVGYEVKLQHTISGEVNEETSKYLDKTLESKNYKANRNDELKEIRNLVTPGEVVTHPDSTVDVFIKTPEGVEYYIDITTVKPNKKEFRVLKRKLLRWTAMRLSINKDADVRAYIAIPYNPEAIQDPSCTEYSRFSTYYDRKDLLVGNELWGLVSNNSFDIMDMISIFQDLNKRVEEKVNNELELALKLKA
ncbi:TdeIII family type II restriction endonuclease [Pseudoalteromonas sp. 31A1]|uniref:TdeIII family type II restriction endonuclease n=1 Tax=Pseudoalteromonas sp. 31A1 TaxID=2686351 RepID=UPI0013FD74D4|nr:TdeIII family type II restriction endonuclease [Pseudoalteromonas sp. 31A1]